VNPASTQRRLLELDGATVLSHVNWTVGADERWVVLGPNAWGKTTLFRVAALYQHPSRNGRALGSASAAATFAPCANASRSPPLRWRHRSGA
jgi:ABC-type molybdenum transport system ATPase subunit/photorepair protein PhrA